MLVHKVPGGGGNSGPELEWPGDRVRARVAGCRLPVAGYTVPGTVLYSRVPGTRTVQYSSRYTRTVLYPRYPGTRVPVTEL